MAETNSLIQKSFQSIWDEPLPNDIGCMIPTGFAFDSRQVVAGNVFVALHNDAAVRDAHIQEAMEKGAALILHDSEHNVSAPETRTYSTKELAMKLPSILASFYQEVMNDLEVVGITGTNGKTTTTYLIAELLAATGKAAGILGTTGYGVWPHLTASSHTTGDLAFNYKRMAEIAALGATHVAMEVSSHALVQNRVAGLKFAQAIFTNLTHEHLDYHGSFKAYQDAKFSLFKDYVVGQAIINLDDAAGRVLYQDLQDKVRTKTYGIEAQSKKAADFFADNIICHAKGVSFTLHTPWGVEQASSPLIGLFNISNLLAALAALADTDATLQTLLPHLHKLKGAKGRMEAVSDADENKPLVIVDYAHTPDALSKALQALKAHNPKKLTCVFGCGGDRDPSKRAVMGEVAATYADKLIVTNDNPRTEAPDKIAETILSGIPSDRSVSMILDRRDAIRVSIQEAEQDEIILIAGKGHEDYQIMGTTHFHFSDQEEVAACFKECKA